MLQLSAGIVPGNDVAQSGEVNSGVSQSFQSDSASHEERVFGNELERYVEENRYVLKSVFGKRLNLDILGDQTVVKLRQEMFPGIKRTIKAGNKCADNFVDFLKKEKKKKRSNLWSVFDLDKGHIEAFNKRESLEKKKKFVEGITRQSKEFASFVDYFDGDYRQYAVDVLKEKKIGVSKEHAFEVLKKLVKRFQVIHKSPHFSTFEKNEMYHRFLSYDMGQNVSFVYQLGRQKALLAKHFSTFLEMNEDISIVSKEEFEEMDSDQKRLIVFRMEKCAGQKSRIEAEMKQCDAGMDQFLAEGKPEQALTICEQLFRKSLALANIEAFILLKKDIIAKVQTAKKEVNKKKKKVAEEARYMTDEEAESFVVDSLENDPMSRVLRNVLYAAMCAAYKSYGNKHFYTPKNSKSTAVKLAKKGRKEWFYDDYDDLQNPFSGDISADPTKSIQSIEVDDFSKGEAGRAKKVNLNPGQWSNKNVNDIERMSNNLHERSETLVSVFYDGQSVGKDMKWKGVGFKLDRDVGKHLRKHYENTKLRIRPKKRAKLINNADRLWEKEWSSYTSWKIYKLHGAGSTGEHLKKIWAKRLCEKSWVWE